MSEQPKKRQLKPAQTIRERRDQAVIKTSKQRIAKEHKILRRLGRIKLIQIIGKILKLVGRFVIPKYFRSSYAELKQVTWPSFSESRKLTFAVLAFAIVFGALVATLDYGLSNLFRIILLK